LTPNKLLACPKNKNEGKSLTLYLEHMSFGAKSQGVHPNFFRFEMETFYDENARQMLPADVRCYILLSEISKNFRQEV